MDVYKKVDISILVGCMLC